MRCIHLCAAAALLISQAALATTYVEDFESGVANGWEPSAPEDWNVVERGNGNHVYRAYLASHAHSAYVSMLVGEFTDFDYRASLRNNSEGASYIIFRAQPGFTGFGGTAYAFGIDADCPTHKPKFFVYKVVDGRYQSLDRWQRSPYARCDSQGNRVRVVARGAKLRFYINGHQVLEYLDPEPLPAGRLGLLGYGGDLPGEQGHEFDNVLVITPP